VLQDREIASLNVVGVDGAESIGVPDDEATAGIFGVRIGLLVVSGSPTIATECPLP